APGDLRPRGRRAGPGECQGGDRQPRRLGGGGPRNQRFGRRRRGGGRGEGFGRRAVTAMTLSLLDTLSGQQRELVPLETGHGRIYSCGPPAYGPAHIRNFR